MSNIENDSLISRTISWAKRNPWKAVIAAVVCFVLLIAVLVVVLVVVKNVKERKKEKLSEGVDDKEGFIFSNDGSDEFAYVQSYLDTSLKGKLDV